MSEGLDTRVASSVQCPDLDMRRAGCEKVFSKRYPPNGEILAIGLPESNPDSEKPSHTKWDSGSDLLEVAESLGLDRG